MEPPSSPGLRGNPPTRGMDPLRPGNDVTSQPAEPASGQQPSETILLLSFGQRDALADQLTAAGYRVVAARRGEKIVRRFLALDIALVVLDARNALEQAQLAAQALNAPSLNDRANILLLYDRDDAESLTAFSELGISAMLPAPWHPAELALALALARRQGRRRGHFHQPVGQMWWQASISDGRITIESDVDSLTARVYPSGTRNLRAALRQMAATDRHRALAAFRKLAAQGGYAAFAQTSLPDGVPGQMVHHLLMSNNRLAGHVEWLDDADAEPQDAPGNPELIPLDQGLHLARSHSALPDAPRMVALFQIDGLDGYRNRAGVAAGHALLTRFARQLSRALRQDLSVDWVACSIDRNRFALVALDSRQDDALALAIRMLSGTIADAHLSRVDAGLRLRMAHGSGDAGEPSATLLARLAKRLVVPQAVVTQLDVSAALALGQIDVRFQPQFELGSDVMSGAEVLARWMHPVLGELGGSTLFSAARAADMERAVSQHVWQQAMAMTSQWAPRQRPPRLAINVTAADMVDPALAANILHCAARNHIEPDRLTVEITESAAIASPDQAAANLSALRRAGVAVALDDFGTGYCGLAWLKQLPVDYIKIDSGFSRDAVGGDHEQAVLQGVVDLARRLGMDVLAEGVENADQRDKLADMGCRWYQGHLRAPAMTGPDFLGFVDRLG